MDYAIAILMFGMAIGLGIYGGLLVATGDIKLLRRRYRYVAKMRDEKAYVRMLGKTVLLCAAAFAAAGLAAFLTRGEHLWIALLVLAAGLGGAFWAGVRMAKKVS